MVDKEICNYYIRTMIDLTKNNEADSQGYLEEIETVKKMCPKLTGVSRVHNSYKQLLQTDDLYKHENSKDVVKMFVNYNRMYDRSFFKQDLTLKEKIKYYIGL